MLAERIDEYIKEKGIKQSAVASALGISQQTMSAICNGNRTLYAEEYVVICKFLEVPYDRFISDDERKAV